MKAVVSETILFHTVSVPWQLGSVLCWTPGLCENWQTIVRHNSVQYCQCPMTVLFSIVLDPRPLWTIVRHNSVQYCQCPMAVLCSIVLDPGPVINCPSLLSVSRDRGAVLCGSRATVNTWHSLKLTRHWVIDHKHSSKWPENCETEILSKYK